MEKDITVELSPSLSKPYDSRYVIVDVGTGEVLDDAQGYGYKSKRNAYAAWGHKHRSPKQCAEAARLKREVQKWMKEHRDFVNLLEAYEFDIAKGSCGPDGKFDAKFVEEMLVQHGLKTDFTPSQFLKVWKKF